MASNEVNLFYLGGLGAQGRTVVTVRSRGKIYNLPPEGQSIRVPRFIADDLIKRHKVRRPEGTFESFTLEPRIAKRVTESGSFMAQFGDMPKKVTVNDVLKNFTIEELQEMIADASANASEGDDDSQNGSEAPTASKLTAAEKRKATMEAKKKLLETDSSEGDDDDDEDDDEEEL